MVPASGFTINDQSVNLESQRNKMNISNDIIDLCQEESNDESDEDEDGFKPVGNVASKQGYRLTSSNFRRPGPDNICPQRKTGPFKSDRPVQIQGELSQLGIDLIAFNLTLKLTQVVDLDNFEEDEDDEAMNQYSKKFCQNRSTSGCK